MGPNLYCMHGLPLSGAAGPVFQDAAPAIDASAAARALDRQLGQWLLAESCGFDGLLLHEQHGRRDSGMIAAGLAAAAVLRQVSTLRLMLHGLPLAMKDPHLWAEELAWLDLASGGRIEASFALGDGPAWWCSPGWPAHARARFGEAAALLERARNEAPPLRHEGEHYSYKFYAPSLQPLQHRMPYAVAGSDGFARTQARQLGWPCLAPDAPRALQTAIARENREAGQAAWLGAHIYLGRQAAALEPAQAAWQAWQQSRQSLTPQWLAPAGLLDETTYRELLEAPVAAPAPAFIGSPPEVADALRAWCDEAGATHLALCFQIPGLADDAVRDSMRLFMDAAAAALTS